jgi:hypothetical protein
MTDAERADYCRSCINTHKNKKELPPCAGCEYEKPQLTAGNQEAWDLWDAVRGQWIMSGMGAPVALDYSAVMEVAALLDIEITPSMWKKLRALEQATKAGAKKPDEEKPDEETDE